MDQPLVTHDELVPWRPFVRALMLSVAFGVAAFCITALTLAWPTVVAEFNWYFGKHTVPALSVRSGEPIPTIQENRLAIPAINVDAPVIYDTIYTDAVGTLPDGVVHVQDTAHPGDVGTMFLIGHSSGYWWQQGKYNQVFALLDKLKTNDQIFINRNGTTYAYRVVSSEVVSPDRVDELDQSPDKRLLSIMTCTPVGTSLNRLIVHAELIQ